MLDWTQAKEKKDKKNNVLSNVDTSWITNFSKEVVEKQCESVDSCQKCSNCGDKNDKSA